MDLLSISFPGADLSQANHLAKDMRKVFISEGFPDDALVVRKDSSESMDLGSVFAVTAAALQVVSMGFDTYSIARSIYEMVRRERCALKIRTPNGIVEFGPGEIDATALRDALTSVIDGKSSQPRV